MAKNLISTGIVTFSIFLFCQVALAQQQCGCTTPETKVALNNSALVVIGRILKVTPSAIKKGYNEITILPNAILKGAEEVRQKNIVIYSKLDTVECGAEFIPGLDYIIYAAGLPAFFTTTSCSRNTLLDSGQEEIDKLRELINKK